jgi:hypothetical protein
VCLPAASLYQIQSKDRMDHPSNVESTPTQPF